MPAPPGNHNRKPKLTEEQVREIYRSTEGCVKLARRFGVDKARIRRIRDGVLWASVTNDMVPR